ncbi:MAG: uncharacterized protein JWM76_1047 [Pseudonocardiales bacterium]|nr:uncharacterized protein [Pseudonocardiales bacterium]
MPDRSDAEKYRAILVVYGRNRTAKDAMFSFLRALDLRPQEWTSLRAATGQSSPYIGDILKSGFDRAQAVVVLSTPDDVAQLRQEYAEGDDDPAIIPMGQARPNVLFEAGMAIGWNADRTVLVELGRVRGLSDLAGRHLLRLDNSSAARHDLVQRLRTAGAAVDDSDGAWLSAGDFTFPDAPTFEVTPATTGLLRRDSGTAEVRDGSLTLRPGKRKRGSYGRVELPVQVTNDAGGRPFSGIVIRATFLTNGDRWVRYRDGHGPATRHIKVCGSNRR